MLLLSLSNPQASTILQAGAQAAAAGTDPLGAKVAAAAKAAADQPLTSDSLAALLPSPDDGVSCLLLQANPQHSGARLSAFAARYGPEPARVYKEDGQGFAVLVFSKAEDRALFVEGLRGGGSAAGAGGGNNNPAAASEMVVVLPGESAAECTAAAAAAAAGGKRKRDAAGQRKGSDGNSKRDQQQQNQQRGPKGGAAGGEPCDIRSVVCPWWNRPYHEQLRAKMESVMGSLRQMADEVGCLVFV